VRKYIRVLDIKDQLIIILDYPMWYRDKHNKHGSTNGIYTFIDKNTKHILHAMRNNYLFYTRDIEEGHIKNISTIFSRNKSNTFINYVARIARHRYFTEVKKHLCAQTLRAINKLSFKHRNEVVYNIILDNPSIVEIIDDRPLYVNYILDKTINDTSLLVPILMSGGDYSNDYKSIILGLNKSNALTTIFNNAKTRYHSADFAVYRLKMLYSNNQELINNLKNSTDTDFLIKNCYNIETKRLKKLKDVHKIACIQYGPLNKYLSRKLINDSITHDINRGVLDAEELKSGVREYITLIGKYRDKNLETIKCTRNIKVGFLKLELKPITISHMHGLLNRFNGYIQCYESNGTVVSIHTKNKTIGLAYISRNTKKVFTDNQNAGWNKRLANKIAEQISFMKKEYLNV
jgi:hypothetical protein